MPYIVTETVIENRIYVEEADIEGLSDEKIQNILDNNPEAFGRDENPHVSPDMFLKIDRSDEAMIDLDELAYKLIADDDDHRETTSAKLTVFTQDDEGRMTETTYNFDFYREGDYQYNVNSRPLSRY